MCGQAECLEKLGVQAAIQAGQGTDEQVDEYS